MAELLVILDGAAERPGPEPTSLERARTPALDRLCARGRVTARRTVPPGLEPGSEAAIPTLLGAPPAVQPSRGLIEAAAVGIEVPPGMSAWRCDLHRGGRRRPPRRPAAKAAALEASAPGCRAHHLRGHRFLLVGTARPQPRLAGLELRVWGDGGHLAPVLDLDTVMICGPGAAAGIARLLGARVRIPDTATAAVGTDLGAKARAGLEELRRSRRVVVHVAAPDEAAHELDPEAKVAALEAIDAELIAPLATAVLEQGGTITVSPDHGTDPRSGRHLDDPVPSVTAGAGIEPDGPERLVERLVSSRRLEAVA